MAQVYVSIGSNVEREQRIRQGIGLLRQQFGKLRVSSVYASAAVGFEGDEFYNLVVGFATVMPPEQLVGVLRNIETICGRDRSLPKFAARTLDLDILLYDKLILQQANIQIPHPEISCFAYVLRPLAELCPECVHPIKVATIQQLWSEFPRKQQPLSRVSITKLDFE